MTSVVVVVVVEEGVIVGTLDCGVIMSGFISRPIWGTVVSSIFVGLLIFFIDISDKRVSAGKFITNSARVATSSKSRALVRSFCAPCYSNKAVFNNPG